MNTQSIHAYNLPATVAKYDSDMDIMHPNRAKMVDVILEVLPFEPQQSLRAVDLGVGTAYLTKRFLEHFTQATVVAIDGASTMMEQAKARLGALCEKVEFCLGDFRNLDVLLKDAPPADVVISSCALHHLKLEEKRAVAKSVRQRLKPGGWFLNADIIIAADRDIESLIQKLRVKGIVRRAQGQDERFRDEASTRKYLDELEARDGDNPLTLAEDLRILEEVGFARVAVFWQEYREAVHGGVNG